MLEIKSFPLGALETNCYLLFEGQQALAIDPGGDPSELLSFLEKRQLQLKYILNTHFHFDHIQGNKSLQDKTGAPIYANSEDAYLLETEVGGGGFMGFPETEPFNYQDFPGNNWQCLGYECRILATPGHTPGSVSLYWPQLKAVFVGDLIFNRSIGRTDFPGGDMNTLIQSVKTHIFTLPGETRIYPGHGPVTSVHEEELHNPFFKEGGMF